MRIHIRIIGQVVFRTACAEDALRRMVEAYGDVFSQDPMYGDATRCQNHECSRHMLIDFVGFSSSERISKEYDRTLQLKTGTPNPRSPKFGCLLGHDFVAVAVN